jgi:recombination protein RecT
MANELAIIKKDIVDVISKKVSEFTTRGELHLPDDYSPENAMKSAWLILQSTVDREKRPVLETCTKNSIANSLLDMVVQGLNPAKKQGYFIAYGKQLVFMRSYFGSVAVAKRVDKNIQDVIGEVVYEGDTFKYKIVRGKKEVTEHEQSLDNVCGKKIRAAYAMIIDWNGEVIKTEIMTIDQIKQAWKQSQMHPVDEKGNVKEGSTHDKFSADMCLKTVINKICKPIINSSNDSHLFKQSVNRSSEVIAEAEVSQEITENANGEIIDVEGEAIDEQGSNNQALDDTKTVAQASKGQPEKQQMVIGTAGTDGPDF